ncbi:unnamed protein product [Euphydryas editha]|uniref:PDZ domain-containing protein n=1 Tax=Euphydryas editha TaxID=104508 RepID=A0AAU9V9Z7_EUPED|nr:unnamed protein product [Euphydryas editha]
MRAELVQARAAGGCQDGGDMLGNVPEAARARAEAAQLARENAALRETVLALHSELFGARLATKYLDKELAGRIQQLQLLGSDMRAELRDSLWAQVEAEILLQRHKTLVRVCRGLAPRAPRPPAPSHAPPAPRTVRVRRSPHLGLGISVTGGREHGVPILISELEAGGPAALTGELYVGDAILAINDLDLTQACHKEAVQALQSVKGDCALCVQFIATDDDDRLSEDNYRFPLYPEDDAFEEAGAAGATPTAPRTPDYNHRASDSECGEVNSYGVRRDDEYGPRDDVHVYGVTQETDSRIVSDGRTYARGDSDTYAASDGRPYAREESKDGKSYAREESNSYAVSDGRMYGREEVNSYSVSDGRTYGREEVGSYAEGRFGARGDRADAPPAHYADYNINNLSILDMDDDSIKIEARLETAQTASASLSTSARSTPVHTRAALKKKRKPQDWRTKGAYCAVSDAQSSDEPRDGPETPNHRPDHRAIAAVSEKLLDRSESPVSGYKPPSPVHETSPCTPKPAAPDDTTTTNVTSATNVTTNSKPSPAPDIRNSGDSLPPPVDTRFKTSKSNGDSRVRKETKGFRIGSARRVTESAHNGDADRRPAAPRLLPGRGDPDFGTPV